MIKLILIDFDDTLSLTEEAYFRIENHVAADMGYKPMSREAHLKNWGVPLKKAITERIPGINADEFMQRIEIKAQEYILRGDADVISDENIKTLETLKIKVMRLGIVTSRRYSEAKHLLEENHHINQYIEKIYHMDNTEFHKPDPRAFDAALKFFAVEPVEAVYIGDSITDGTCANQAGLHFIACLESGLRTEKDFKAVNVDFFAKKFVDVLKYLNRGK